MFGHLYNIRVYASMATNNWIVKAQSSPQYSPPQSAGEQQANQQLLKNGLFIHMPIVYYAKERFSQPA